ncbi:MAG TPA: anti-sigma factor antagonist [Acidimicrobiia bacterium]|nr:anti-sigma factor antagonist [Acidimicrobiia bacterium]
MHAPDEPNTAPRVALEVVEMGRTTPFSVEIDHIGTTDIVTVRGEIDIVSAPEFKEKLSTVGSTIVVDLRHLDFMDSSGLAVLLRRNAMLDGSSELRLVVKPGIIERLFELSGIDKVFSIYQDIEAAIDGGFAVPSV